MKRDCLTGISFSDEATPLQSFAYNILGLLTQVTDAAGTRSIAYNEYSEQQSDALDSDAHTHLVTERRDRYGRSTGFTDALSGSTQFTTSVGYCPGRGWFFPNARRPACLEKPLNNSKRMLIGAPGTALEDGVRSSCRGRGKNPPSRTESHV